MTTATTEKHRSTLGAAIGAGVTAAILTAVLLLAVSAVAIPAIAGAQTYAILTPSMQPTYPVGTLIVVRAVPPDNLDIGDVITFQQVPDSAAVITHRIIGITATTAGERTFVTRGDDNDVEDPEPIAEEQIRGQLWYAVPWIGWIATARTQGPLGALVPITGVLLIGWGGYAMLSSFVDRMRARRSHS